MMAGERETILVTGGAGYIGSHSVIELCNAGYDVIIIDNFINSNQECIRRLEEIVNRKIPCLTVDIQNLAALDEVFQKHPEIKHVIHFAALKAVGESILQPMRYYKNNLVATINLLECMHKHKVRSLVFSSSATVYGESKSLPLSENSPTGGCTNPYGKSKYFIEEMLKDFYHACTTGSESDREDWRIVILRYFNPVGAHESGRIGEDPSGVPNNLMPFVAQVAVGRLPEVKVFGNDFPTPDGTGVRDYIHVVDLAKGHVAALEKLKHPDCGLKIYNLGTGRGYSVLEMVAAMEKASGKHIPYSIVARRSGDVPSVYSDVSLAEKELHWKAERGLDQMCADMWRWQSQNPHGFAAPSKGAGDQ
jgi:UDP-glucose 4-epimerase